MSNSPNPSIQQLWQCQPVEGKKMSIEEIRTRAAKFEKKIMWRNIREYAGSAIAAGLLTSFLVKSHDVLFQIACGLMIAGLAYMAYQLHRRTSPRSLPGDLGAANSLQFHRSELERQMDFLKHIWRWYLWPLVPGLAAFSLTTVVHGREHPLPIVLVNSLFAFSLILVWRLNAYAVRCLQRRIDELQAS